MATIRPQRPIARRRGVSLLALSLSPLSPLAAPAALHGQAEEDDPPWRWSEQRVFEAVERVRAGRSLNPESWPGGARV
ncbi:MAG: hypothetical protein R3266_09240, partial [Gemmatimonadota bacterium]|nr:hypothetical protein [Gemmatimonadota bacterium]